MLPGMYSGMGRSRSGWSLITSSQVYVVSGGTVTFPASGFVSGDLIVVCHRAGSPSGITPLTGTNFTEITKGAYNVDTLHTAGGLSYRISNGTENGSSQGGFSVATSSYVLYVSIMTFRNTLGPVTGVSIGDPETTVATTSGGAPANHTMALSASSGAVLGVVGATNFGTNPVVASSPDAYDETYQAASGTPASVSMGVLFNNTTDQTISMTGAARAILHSGYLTATF